MGFLSIMVSIFVI